MNFNLPTKIYGELSEIPPNTKTIGTHNGRFHADDVLAVGMLLQLPLYRDASVIRSRDPEVLDKCDIVVDVGLIYDPERLRFDHHQRSFDESYSQQFKNVTKLSSAGLVFKHFGDSLLSDVYGIKMEKNDMERCKTRLYEVFFLSVDAIDNGVSACQNPLFTQSTDLSSRISRLNAEWFEWDDMDFVSSTQFIKALELVLSELGEQIDYLKRTYLYYSQLIQEAFRNRFVTHPSGRVLELPGGFAFMRNLVEVEEKFQDQMEPTPQLPNGILFVIYPSSATSWRVRGVNISVNTFQLRLCLPERLKGRRDNELAELPGLQFVHVNGFLAGVDSKEVALRLIDMTLNEKMSILD